MAKKIVRKNTTPKEEGEKKFTEIKPAELTNIAPSENYVVTLSTEDTKFLVTFKNDQVVQCMALDGTYETINIPVSQFNRAKYSFESEDGTKHTAVVSVFIQN